MLIIAFRITLIIDVKSVCFGRHMAVCVQKWHKNAVFGCSWLQLFTAYAPDLFNKNRKHIQICVSVVDSFIYHDFEKQSFLKLCFTLMSTTVCPSAR